MGKNTLSGGNRRYVLYNGNNFTAPTQGRYSPLDVDENSEINETSTSTDEELIKKNFSKYGVPIDPYSISNNSTDYHKYLTSKKKRRVIINNKSNKGENSKDHRRDRDRDRDHREYSKNSMKDERGGRSERSHKEKKRKRDRHNKKEKLDRHNESHSENHENNNNNNNNEKKDNYKYEHKKFNNKEKSNNIGDRERNSVNKQHSSNKNMNDSELLAGNSSSDDQNPNQDRDLKAISEKEDKLSRKR